MAPMHEAEARISAVLRALARLAEGPAVAWAEGLGEANAEAGLRAAVGAITGEGLRAELQGGVGPLPEGLLLVCAGGVFTAPLEWVALVAAAGIPLWVKPPGAAPAFPRALVAAMAAEGLAVRLHEGRDVPAEASVILAFGSDETLRALASAWPDRRLVGYGHAWSAALWWPDVQDSTSRHSWMSHYALDLCHYDGRGCMAPTALFVLDDPAQVEAELYDALERAEARWPAGPLPGALGPLLRERVGLARVLGRAKLGRGFGVLTLPLDRFRPFGLPRHAVIHPVADHGEIERALAGWPGLRSTLGAGGPSVWPSRWPDWTRVFTRICPLGTMQTPPFPRLHDGRPMLASIATADDGPRLRGER